MTRSDHESCIPTVEESCIPGLRAWCDAAYSAGAHRWSLVAAEFSADAFFARVRTFGPDSLTALIGLQAADRGADVFLAMAAADGSAAAWSVLDGLARAALLGTGIWAGYQLMRDAGVELLGRLRLPRRRGCPESAIGGYRGGMPLVRWLCRRIKWMRSDRHRAGVRREEVHRFAFPVPELAPGEVPGVGDEVLARMCRADARELAVFVMLDLGYRQREMGQLLGLGHAQTSVLVQRVRQRIGRMVPAALVMPARHCRDRSGTAGSGRAASASCHGPRDGADARRRPVGREPAPFRDCRREVWPRPE